MPKANLSHLCGPILLAVPHDSNSPAARATGKLLHNNSGEPFALVLSAWHGRQAAVTGEHPAPPDIPGKPIIPSRARNGPEQTLRAIMPPIRHCRCRPRK